jgi:hypothetical protein
VSARTRFTEAGVLAALFDLTIAHGRTPTLRELADHVGMSGPRQALWWTQRLQRRGVLYTDRRIAFTKPAAMMVARCILDLRDPEMAAAELLPEGAPHG